MAVPRIDPSVLASRRQRIVDAAGRCLDRSGPGGLTTRAVVAEAGISTGALYHHFATLDALAEELAAQRSVARVTEVAARAPGGEDPLAWLVRALVCAPPEAPPTTAERVVAATVDEVLRAATAAGSLRSDLDHEALAEVLALLWEAVDRRAAAGSLRTTPERLATVLTAVLDGGCRPATNG